MHLKKIQWEGVRSMKLRKPSENKMNIQKLLNANSKTEEFKNIRKLNNLLNLNNLFIQIENKIKQIKEKIIYEILETPQKPKKYKRTLKRSKQM